MFHEILFNMTTLTISQTPLAIVRSGLVRKVKWLPCAGKLSGQMPLKVLFYPLPEGDSQTKVRNNL